MKNPNSFFEGYSKSAWNKNVDEMVALYSNNIEMYDLWNKGYYKGIDAVRKNTNDWFNNLGSDKVQVIFEDIHLLETEEVAISFGFIKYIGISFDGNVLRSMKNRISIGFNTIQGEWKVIHQHISLPINSDDMKANFNI